MWIYCLWENLSLFQVAIMNLIYWSVRSSIRRGGYVVKGWIKDIVILYSCEYHFIVVHANLVKHLNNTISTKTSYK